MACTVEVVLPNSRVPQGNIGHVLSCPIHDTLDLSPVYPAHETNDTLMFLTDKFVFKHRTHKRIVYDLLVQRMTHQLVLHGNSLQSAKLAHHTDRQVPLHYVVANKRDNGRP
jgi:hypothetical protein